MVGRSSPGVAICFRSAAANGELRPAPSSATLPGWVEKLMSVPSPNSTAAGQNYLVPIDAKLTTAAALDFAMVRWSSRLAMPNEAPKKRPWTIKQPSFGARSPRNT
jgi:hypothetical protein